MNRSIHAEAYPADRAQIPADRAQFPADRAQIPADRAQIPAGYWPMTYSIEGHAVHPPSTAISAPVV
ncbi:hypothetical protein GOARA_078_00200 [Gordonia araii NBRC 100433]|uniref:Uncharacterized protein n=1 Tax=Gordonia araii NBRC 100433 TaxID=1073574 RepID=G7H6U6_9ACTN|nr:hypothetical protein GOARA_078_00200 [Gordonia araii NBRC 100433]